MENFKTANNGKTFESFLNDMNVNLEIIGDKANQYYELYIKENEVTAESIAYGIF